MPNITLRLPATAFDAARCARLLQAVHAAAVRACGLGNDPRQQALCWVMLEHTAPGQWLCGGHDPLAHAIPCQVHVLAPAGVLDAAHRAAYARALHDAIAAGVGADEPRRMITSIVIEDVADGHWAVNGQVWQRDDFVRAAGYAHLQPAPPVRGVR
ncbi:hypothetical protein ACLB90_11590 [Stenotrophomonas sp. LGBM10]|uniref:hypothetical protein n=1 Tax=Stenotrophomonas sp. LGBM10 TaxID=3390038 RepID=UPI00398A88FE